MNGWTSFCPRRYDRDAFILNLFPPGVVFSDWVKNNGNDDYSLSRSAFWRMARKIYTGLYGDNCFAENIAYSNLYKIARSNKNPTTRQCEIQQKVCSKILLAEINFLKPRHIVFMTGLNWAEEIFAKIPNAIKISGSERRDAIECFGSIVNCPFIVIPHPQGKKEEPIAEALIKQFEREKVL